MNIQVNCNNSIKLIGSKIIYIDPYEIENEPHDADYIFCTHSHYDHFSPEDIKKVKNDNTKIITVNSAKEGALKLFAEEDIKIVLPGNKYNIDNIEFETTYAYNETKQFHPKGNRWVGFIIEFDGEKYFIAGDTDNIPELQNIKTDFAFLPVGGTYTMDYKEAAKLANLIDAKTVIPTHYGSVVGKKEDGERFKSLIKNKEVILFNISKGV